jgi:hypothetical protein
MTSQTSTATLTPIDDAPASAAHDADTPQERADETPGIPYRSMATLLGAALDQAQLIAPPLTRALALDSRIGADPHLRRAQQLLARLNAELAAELDALSAHTHAPVAGMSGTTRPSHT